jgi:hypothetical protein
VRAVLSAKVTLVPSMGANSTGDQHPSTFPSRAEIREALSACGLAPLPLTRFRRQASEVEDGGDRSEISLFRQLAKVVGDTAKEREDLDPDELLVADDSKVREKGNLDYSDAASKYIPPDTKEHLKQALRGLAGLALPVLTRMPARSMEDRDKRRSVAESLLFASVITPTRTLFIVNSENESAVTFRLHHQLIERLQRGCEDLFELLNRRIDIQGGVLEFRFQSPIEIYEVGQEDPTILGEIVGTSTRSRIRYALNKDRAAYVVVGVLALVFCLLLVLVQGPLDDGTVRDQIVTVGARQYIERTDGFWEGHGQRLQSGVIPVLLVTAITLLIKFPRRLVISWSQRYGSDNQV